MPQKTLTIINRVSVSFFLVVVVDVLFFGGKLKSLLPSTVTQFTWYYFIFGMPHIMASYVAYFSKEYFIFYKKELVKGVVINLFLLVLIFIFLPKLFIYFFIAYTMYHVAWQQIGICRKYIKNNKFFRIWSISGIISVIVLAVSIGGEAQVFIPYQLFYILQLIGLTTVFFFFGISINIFDKEEYVLTTSLIIFLSAIAILSGYYIVGIIIMRFTHDISAFSIYIKHDMKYYNKFKLNYVYNLFRIKEKQIIFFLPILSMLVGSFLIIDIKHSSYALLFVYVFISMLHYYMESKVWRSGSLHRQTIVS